MRKRLLITAAVLLVLGVAIALPAYDIVTIDFDSFMENQPSINYQEPPRRLPPADAIPVGYAAPLTGASVLENPVPKDQVSLQRGAVLFSVTCAVCHGADAKGDGSVVQFWKPGATRPVNLLDFAGLSDGVLYTYITEGFGAMPPIRENLNERERWDVINHLRSLQGK